MTEKNDHERFTEYWTDAQPAVSHYIRSLIRNSSAAKDVLQATALALHRKFADFDPNQRFLPWALTFAKFEVLAHRRNHARGVVRFDSDLVDRFTESWAEVAPAIADEAHVLQGCIGKLTEKSRQVVRLRYIDDLNATQIAKKMGRAPGNIRVMLQRIRAQLRECIQRAARIEGDFA